MVETFAMEAQHKLGSDLSWYRHSANGTKWHILDEDDQPLCTGSVFDAKEFSPDRDFKSLDQDLPLGSKCSNCMRIMRYRSGSSDNVLKA